MKTILFLSAFLLASSFSAARGGELQKPYFAATKPGAWSEYLLTTTDGAKSSFTYERQPDDEGRVVIEVQVRILAGPGQDSQSKVLYTLAKNFDLDRDGLSYGKFTEKMATSAGGGPKMNVDAETLGMIREGEKDFRGAVTFEAAEKMNGRMCDKYAYSLRTAGPSPTCETGELWLDAAVPFAIVRQSAKITKEDGAPVTDFDMRLQDTGLNQAIAAAAAPVRETETLLPVEHEASLAAGFKTGVVSMEVEAIPGSSRLSLTVKNKTEAKATIDVPAGEMEFEAGAPVNTLKITNPKAIRLVLPAEGSAEPFTVTQRGARGITEGRCTLSVFEGTPLFSGSVTMGNLPK